MISNHYVVDIVISGTEDETTCRAICNVIDKALLVWNVGQARD